MLLSCEIKIKYNQNINIKDIFETVTFKILNVTTNTRFIFTAIAVHLLFGLRDGSTDENLCVVINYF